MQDDHEDGSVSYWLDELKAGNERAATQIWQRYFQTLVAVARQNLRRSATRAADEEDVALSAFDSFIRGLDRGKFRQIEDRNDLWRLLLVITVRKAADLANREGRLKRGGGRVNESSKAGASGPGLSLEEVLSVEPTPEVAAMIQDELRFLLGKLVDPNLKTIALKKMEGYTDEEIAQQQNCVRRTIVRKLGVIRKLWADEITR
jgi:DNA-directed RNA polymerase specialized sigma24 family protein